LLVLRARLGLLAARITFPISPIVAEALAVEGPALVHLLLDERDISPFTDEPSV
jgi:hypothetical protein